MKLEARKAQAADLQGREVRRFPSRYSTAKSRLRGLGSTSHTWDDRWMPNEEAATDDEKSWSASASDQPYGNFSKIIPGC